jgi:hypothetical protein
MKQPKTMKKLNLTFMPQFSIDFLDLEIKYKGRPVFVTGRAEAYAANVHNDLLKDDIEEITSGEITPRDIKGIIRLEVDEVVDMEATFEQSFKMDEWRGHAEYLSHSANTKKLTKAIKEKLRTLLQCKEEDN